jgi:PIN domain nuclease of toxin-antitoxin system
VSAVLDATAMLAFLSEEPGAHVVEEHLLAGAHCSAVNWSEVAQKVRAAGRDWDLSAALLRNYGLTVNPAEEPDAERAAGRWRRGEGLSLADRFCLALGHRLGLPAVTADTAWGESDSVRQIR